MMSTANGPKIMSDGLVLYHDAANMRSFKGEPTVNLIHYPLAFASNWTYESWTGTVTDNAVMAPDSTMTATIVNRINGYQYQGTEAAPPEGTMITFSCWVKSMDGGTHSNEGIWIYSYSGSLIGVVAQSSQEITNSWKRLSLTYTVLPTQAIFSYGISGVWLSGQIAIWHPQLEYKSYSTPFVPGTRGTTVATGGGLFDMSGNLNHGELVNGVSHDHNHNGSVQFDGIDDFVNCGNNSSLSFGSGAFSISLWIKASTYTFYDGIIFHGDPETDHGFYLRRTNSTDIQFLIRNGATYGGLGLCGIMLNNAWQYLTLQLKDNYVEIYRDGIDLGGHVYIASPNTTVSNDNFIIGCDPFSSRHFTGCIENVQVFNRALTASEVLQNYNATKYRFAPAIPTDGLILHWDVSRYESYPKVGTTIYDLSGNNNNGTLYNGVVYDSGKFVFDGIDDLVGCNTFNLASSNFTIIAASRYSGSNKGRVISDYNTNWLFGHHGGYVDRFHPFGWVNLSWDSIDYLSTDWKIYAGTGNITANQYQFFSNNTNMTEYPNGGGSGPNGISVGGGGFTTEWSTCEFSFVLIYNRVLTTTEITEIYLAHKDRFNL